MKLKKIITSHVVIIGLLTLGLLAAITFEIEPLRTLEHKTYDLALGMRQAATDSPVAIVAIDDASIAQIGDWPWPRGEIAGMLGRLSEYGADSLGICLLYSQTDLNPALQEIEHLKAELLKHAKLKRYTEFIKNVVDDSKTRLDQDKLLGDQVLAAHNVVLPFRLKLTTDPTGNGHKPSGMLVVNSIPLPVTRMRSDTAWEHWRNRFTQAKHSSKFASGVTETLKTFSGKAGGLGHINIVADTDGVVRRLPLLIPYGRRYVPSMALAIAAKYVDTDIRSTNLSSRTQSWTGLHLKHLAIPTDDQYRMYLDYDRAELAPPRYSFADVMQGKIAPAMFKDKIVLLGITAEGATETYRTPSGNQFAPVEVLAEAVSDIASRRHLTRPWWAFGIEILVLVYFGLFLTLVIPRIRLRVGAMILAIFLATWLVAVVVAMNTSGNWLRFWGPTMMALVGYALIAYRQGTFKKLQERWELNRLLGISLQERGMLDMAFEKFQRCSLDDPSVKELLYTLGLDFERKRKFPKALRVYEYLLKGGNFKDIKKRVNRLQAPGGPMAIGNLAGTQEPTLVLADTAAKPTFGRYEILEEIGRGAMGTVYLGQDPKINRKVAIKTLDYRDVDENEIDEVKSRFFREAEAAGKLSHPNIVTVYDVGEEHDMAYIAMELLEGKDLTVHCGGRKRLPFPEVLRVVGSVANALAYAHGEGVVHRDIKPANIMLLTDGQVKLTDFGIARVKAASRTSTGIILGTPNYMSPEQVKGGKVDGRSDLFSLGVVFYELVTGEKPFKGDNLNNLLYQIVKGAFTPPEDIRKDLPSCCAAIVNQLLKKNLTQRYKSATALAKAVEACRAKL